MKRMAMRTTTQPAEPAILRTLAKAFLCLFACALALLIETRVSFADGHFLARCTQSSQETDAQRSSSIRVTGPKRLVAGYTGSYTLEIVLPQGDRVFGPFSTANAAEAAPFQLMQVPPGSVSSVTTGQAMSTAGQAQPGTAVPSVPGQGMKREQLTVTLLAAPTKAGTHDATVELGVDIQMPSRAHWQLCSAPLSVTIVDPSEATPEAEPRVFPEPVRQWQPWLALRITLGIIVLGLALLVAWVWRRRRLANAPRAKLRKPAPSETKAILRELDQAEAFVKAGKQAAATALLADTMRYALLVFCNVRTRSQTTSETRSRIEAGAELDPLVFSPELRNLAARILEEGDYAKFGPPNANEVTAETRAKRALNHAEALRTFVTRHASGAQTARAKTTRAQKNLDAEASKRSETRSGP
jgi:hypothetical protein